MGKVDRTVIAFFVLFMSVYFLESIGGFFMTSAIVSIEKQFQIPSKVSGLMVSAGDFGYIPAVVFVSYLGSKGNRARWIGGGCTLIAIANMLISSSNFLFPVGEVVLDTSTLEREIEWNTRRLPPTANFEKFLAELPSEQMRQRTREKIHNQENANQFHWLTEFDECLGDNFTRSSSSRRRGQMDESCGVFYKFLHKYNAANKSDVDNLRLLSATSYAFCDKTLNALRGMIDKVRCGGDISNVGPTATIFIGLLILGVGRTMPFSLGLPLIDDNVRKANLPLYFAGMFCIRIMGPMLGFQMGAWFNKRYYKGNPPYGITPRDPLWIGCWWGGFLTIGLVLFLPSLLLFCFRNPKQKGEAVTNADGNDGNDVDGRKEKAENDGGKQTESRGLALFDRHLEKGDDGKASMPEGIGGMCRDFFKTISSVLRRPIYRWAMAGRIIDVLAFKGFHIFLPKYLELQFGIPQYEVNRLMGMIGVPAFAFGVLFGSLAMRLLRLQGRRAATWVTVTGALAACFSLMNSSVGCKSTMTALGESISSGANVNSTCLLGCHCESSPLYPVCDMAGAVFYSPCHAGCHLTNANAFLSNGKTPIFDDCACAERGQVSREFCDEGNCRSRMLWYFGNMAVGGVIAGMGVVPGVLIMLRSVPPEYRSISLGFNGFLVSLLATLPSPIIWGAIIDHFCLFWSKRCDGKGACALYATNDLRVWLHGLYGALRLISLITDLFVIYHAKELKLTDDEEGEGEGNNKKDGRGRSKRNGSDKIGENSLLDQEQNEPLKNAIVHHVHDISCAPPSYDEEEENNSEDGDEAKRNMEKKNETLQKSSSLPRDVKPGHRRNASKDVTSELLPPVKPSEFEVIRKTSSHHPISDF